MLPRTQRSKLVSPKPLRMNRSSWPLPAGACLVEIGEELVEDSSFPAHRRLATTFAPQPVPAATLLHSLDAERGERARAHATDGA